MIRARPVLWIGALLLIGGPLGAAEAEGDDSARLAEELRLLRQDHDALEQRFQRLSEKVSGRLSGYIDLGLFWVSGDGTGIRTDPGRAHFPQYADVPDSWVFAGDPLSVAINARGDVPTTGESRAVTFNPVNNGGVLSAILSNVNLSLFAGLSDRLVLAASIDYVPRGRNVSDPNGLFLGDYLDMKLAYVEYTLPIDRIDLRLSAGKLDSVLGIEYRWQEAPARITATPSLICRYTCGRPIGVKARLRLPRDLFVLNVAVTNGSHTIEGFPFGGEIDTNYFKTVAARLSARLPFGRSRSGLELGASGAFGAQDFQPQNDVYHWHYGFDLHLQIRDFDLRAEFVQGAALGQDDPRGVPCGVAPCLRYLGAYGQAAYRVLTWLMPYVRADFRDAFHRSGQSFVYVTRIVRATVGARLDLSESVLIKAEYTFNIELPDLPQFPDDIFTSSLVAKY